MKVNNLKIKAFKSIEELEINFDPQLTIITSADNLGKTCILEALYKMTGSYRNESVLTADDITFKHLSASLTLNHQYTYTLEISYPPGRPIDTRDFFKTNSNLPDRRLSTGRLESSIIESVIEQFIPNIKLDHWAVEKEGNRMTINNCSSSEKQLIDLCYITASALTAAEKPGVSVLVLIDNIETYLSPTQQKEILPKLLSCFPSVQFVVTTKSPLVISSVPSKHCRLLVNIEKGLDCIDNLASYGKDANTIFEDILELKTTRPERVEADLDKLFDLIDDLKFTNVDFSEVKTHYIQIKNYLGADKDLLKAKVLINCLGCTI